MRLQRSALYSAFMTMMLSVIAQDTNDNLPINITFPYPYQNGWLRLTSPGPSADPTAIATIYRINPCGGGTSFASTTTINLPIDCYGASTLSRTVRVGGCPKGLSLPPATVDTVTATPSTHFDFTCAATPAPSGPGASSYQLTDMTRKPPLPTLRADQTPPEKPISLEVVHHADGTCRVTLGLEQADPAYDSRRDRIYHECLEQRLRPTVYAATVTTKIIVDCDGCWYIRGGDLTRRCPGELSTVPAGTTTASVTGTKTKWAYECQTRGY